MLSALLLGLLLVPSRPDYVRYQLHELVAFADRIVYGSITAVGPQTFDLTVHRDLLGGGDPNLRLRRFVDWPCAARWAPYEVGQQVVLFLAGDRAMGAGDEGDWPVVDGVVRAPYSVHGIEMERVSLGDDELHHSPLGLDELEAAIRGFRATFEAYPEEVDDRTEHRLRFELDEAAALAFSRKSKLALHLFEEATSSRRFDADHLPPPAAGLLAVPIIRAKKDGFSPPPDPSRSWTPKWDSDFGSELASLGDLDGDGWDDLAALGDQRTLWILFLGANGRLEGRRAITPESLGITGTWFAESLATVGDLDGDGVPDLAVGAPSREESEPGRIWLLHLQRDGSVEKAVELDATERFGPGFGSSFAVLDDGSPSPLLFVNVSAMYAGLDALFGREERSPHALWLCSVDGGALRSSGSVLARELSGSEVTVTFGDAMAGIGDLDHDGVSEVAIGYPFDGDGGEERGAVWIVGIAPDGSARIRQKISDWTGRFPGTLRNGDHFGKSVAAPGDLDGDTVPDLIVGGEQELWTVLLQRDGTVKGSHQFGARSGGFVPASRIRSLAVLSGPARERRLAVAATRGEEGRYPHEAVVWLFRLTSNGELKAIQDG